MPSGQTLGQGPLAEGRLSTVDLLVLIITRFFGLFFYERNYPNEDNRTEFSLSVSVPFWVLLVFPPSFLCFSVVVFFYSFFVFSVEAYTVAIF